VRETHHEGMGREWLHLECGDSSPLFERSYKLSIRFLGEYR
jgi:hypothetical protein